MKIHYLGIYEKNKDRVTDFDYLSPKHNPNAQRAPKLPKCYGLIVALLNIVIGLSLFIFTIYYGKNNIQNDYLTLKFADKQDIWFHVKNYPGSHVVVFAEGETVPDSTLTEAAILAATNSKADGKKVAVDYTQVRYVKKPSGAKPGMVIYTNYKTAYVDVAKNDE